MIVRNPVWFQRSAFGEVERSYLLTKKKKKMVIFEKNGATPMQESIKNGSKGIPKVIGRTDDW